MNPSILYKVLIINSIAICFDHSEYKEIQNPFKELHFKVKHIMDKNGGGTPLMKRPGMFPINPLGEDSNAGKNRRKEELKTTM